MVAFAARAGVASAAGRVVFGRGVRAPLTVATDAPQTGPGVHGFEVHMPTKEARTAIGFAASPVIQTYMTPNHSPGVANYVSMGGAGFIYPEGRASSGRYGEGDTVRCELDFDAATVTFLVNGARVGLAPWPHGTRAWPAISSEGGEVVCKVNVF